MGRRKKNKTLKGNKKAKENDVPAEGREARGDHGVALIGNGIINEASKRTTAVGAITM